MILDPRPHFRRRMKQRNISDADVFEVLNNVISTHSTPEDSTCIVGKTSKGRVLKIWIVGTTYPPPTGVWILKSIAAKGENDG